jgi:acetate kinase
MIRKQPHEGQHRKGFGHKPFVKPTQPSILTINGGSSSIRFALYEEGEPLRLLLDGKVDRVGLSGTNLTFHDSTGKPEDSRPIDNDEHHSAVAFLLKWLEKRQVLASVKAIGHRVVHGMTHTEPEHGRESACQRWHSAPRSADAGF